MKLLNMSDSSILVQEEHFRRTQKDRFEAEKGRIQPGKIVRFEETDSFLSSGNVGKISNLISQGRLQLSSIGDNFEFALSPIWLRPSFNRVGLIRDYEFHKPVIASYIVATRNVLKPPPYNYPFTEDFSYAFKNLPPPFVPLAPLNSLKLQLYIYRAPSYTSFEYIERLYDGSLADPQILKIKTSGTFTPDEILIGPTDRIQLDTTSVSFGASNLLFAYVFENASNYPL